MSWWQVRIFFVVVIWGAMFLALLTGYIYTSNYRTSRSSDPKLYWAGMATGTVAAIIATVLFLRG